jgi:hypothetical protein
VIDHAFFMVIASLGVTLAGFAALLHGLRRGEDFSQLSRWRIRLIVELGFTAAVLALGVIAIDAFVDDDSLAIKIASGLFLVGTYGRFWWWTTLKDREVYRNRRDIARLLFSSLVQAGVAVFNVFKASYGVLLVLYIFLVMNPASIFSNFVGELYTPPGRKQSQ